jgi:diguanylate cyclase (GGDEF)-like protein
MPEGSGILEDICRPPRPADLRDEPTSHLVEALEGMGALVALHDPDDHLRFSNAAFREALFIGPDETPTWEQIMRRNHALNRGTVLKTDDVDTWIRSTASRRGRVARRSFETDLHDGRWFTAYETVLHSGWTLFVAVEVTDLYRPHRELREARDSALKASQTDDLTGISNRRHIMAHLEDLLAGRSAHGPVSGCTCLIDLDHFKAVNDCYGHPTGDLVLMRFAEVIRQGTRPKDSFGRLGGEEFLLNFPATTLTEAVAIITRLLDQIRTTLLIPTKPDLRLTFSAGLTAFAGGETVSAIYSRCDKALYEAKHAGRDRLAVVSD